MTIAQLLPCLQDMKADHWSMIVFWNEAKGSAARRGPDVDLDFTDQPAPAPEVPQPTANDDDGNYPGYEDPHAGMPVDDEDMPQSQQPEPDLDDDPIELGSGDNPPPAPPGGGTFVPVPEDDSEDLDMPYDPENDDGGHPPGGGP